MDRFVQMKLEYARGLVERRKGIDNQAPGDFLTSLCDIVNVQNRQTILLVFIKLVRELNEEVIGRVYCRTVP